MIGEILKEHTALKDINEATSDKIISVDTEGGGIDSQKGGVGL